MRGCPATGRMAHQFDKNTHRCRCGRWERGFAPKKEPVRQRAECQICERQQAVSLGRMVHHGYRRPGIGFIQGDCYGVGHTPYPATDALVQYLVALNDSVAARQKHLESLEAAEELTYEFERFAGRWAGTTVTVRKGDTCQLHESRYMIPGFDDLKAQKVRNVQRCLEMTRAEQDRVTKRIAAAAAKEEAK